MSLNIQERQWVDRYLRGELTGIELEDFIRRISEDDVLKREVELQQILYKGIHMAQEERLKRTILAAVNYRKPLVPFALKMIVTFLTVLLIGITVWFYTADNSTSKTDRSYWRTLWNGSGKKAPDREVPQKQGTESKQTASSRTSPAGNVKPATADIQSEQAVDSLHSESIPLQEKVDSVKIAVSDEEIIVKQDQLLITATLPVTDKSEHKQADSDSLSQSVAEKLNPAADLPEADEQSGSFSVEFWVSPVNYRGYKMSKNKLVLFGIEEPDAVKLYRVNNDLYMYYLKDYYRLNNSFEFMAYQKLKDSEIPFSVK